MSSGVAVIPLAAMFLIPAALAAVAIAAVAVAGAAVVVLMARAAMAGAQALAGGMVRLGEMIDAQVDAYFDAQQASQLWQLAATEIARRNARIATMTKQAKAAGAGPDVPIPPPFDLTGKNLCEIRDWCEQVDVQLAQAQAQLHNAIVAATASRLAASLPATNVALVSAAEALANGQLAAEIAEAQLRRRADASAISATTAASAAASRQQREAAAIAGQVDLLLAGLSPAIFADDHARAVEAAARAVSADPPQAGRLQLEDLKVIISEANKRAEDAEKAAHLLQGLGFDPLPGDLNAEDFAVISRLERVAAGESELEAELIADAQRVLHKVEAGGLEMFLRQQVTQILTETGWEVEESTGSQDVMLTRSDWPEHHLQVLLDGSQLRYVTWRDYEVAGDQAARLDHEACEQSAASLKGLVKALNSRGAGVAAIEQHANPPVRYLADRPTNKRHDHQERPRPQQRTLKAPSTQE
jgi:hypothetical protein